MHELLVVTIQYFFLVVFIIEGIYIIVVLVHIFILFLSFFFALVDGGASHILRTAVRIWQIHYCLLSCSRYATRAG